MRSATHEHRAASRGGRRGGVLIEFALVSFALYLILAALIGLGRWMTLVQATQATARFAAREMALYPLPADFTFADALADPGFRAAVYDPDFLVVDLDVTPAGPALDAAFAAMPVVNRAMRPLMIVSTAEVQGLTRNLMHVPGALIDSATSPTGLTVAIPRVDARDPDSGAETAITLLPVLEEVGPGSFSLGSPDRGLVALRLNVPYQSATLTAYLPRAELTTQGNPFQDPITAIDPAGGGSPVFGPGPNLAGPYSGTYGLGAQFVLGQTVRPFRRLVTAQALFRREVFL